MKDFGKFPVLSDGINGSVSKDIGGAIKRMYKKIPDSKMTNRWYRRVSKDGSSFLANQVLGKEKVRDLFRQAFKKMGVSNWETLCMHSLCAVFITKLANDPSVNLKEVMHYSCHTSVSASATYQKTSVTSECNRLRCLLGSNTKMEPPKPVYAFPPNPLFENKTSVSPSKPPPTPSDYLTLSVNKEYLVLTQFEQDELDDHIARVKDNEKKKQILTFCIPIAM